MDYSTSQLMSRVSALEISVNELKNINKDMKCVCKCGNDNFTECELKVTDELKPKKVK